MDSTKKLPNGGGVVKNPENVLPAPSGKNLRLIKTTVILKIC